MTTPQPDDSRRDAAERFIAGEDRLSALLRDMPRFEAPPSLASAVATAAQAVQARMAAEAERDVARASAPPATFTAPPTLSDTVLREAARLQAAQATRRDVVFDQVLQGKPANSVLGAPVSASTEAWLRTQAAQHREAPVAETPPAPPVTRASTVSRWWKSLGVAATAFAVAGLATKIVLSQLDDGTPMTASLSSNVIIADNGGAAPGGAPAQTQATAAAPVAPSSQEARTGEAPSTAAPEYAAPHGAPHAAPQAESARRPATPSPVARKERVPTPAPALAPSPSAETSPAPAIAAAQPAPPPPAAPAAPAILAAPAPMASMQAQADAIPAPPPAFAPGAGAEPRARRAPQSAYLAAPAPAPAESLAVAKAAAPVAQKSATATLEDDPASVAMQWRPGKDLRVWSAEPDNAAVRDWVARLWAAMPAEARPAAPYGIQRDEALARGQLRIEQGASSPAVK